MENCITVQKHCKKPTEDKPQVTHAGTAPTAMWILIQAHLPLRATAPCELVLVCKT